MSTTIFLSPASAPVGLQIGVPANNALDIVNRIQDRLRLPRSSAFSGDAHAALLLSFVNDILMGPVADAGHWEEQKFTGSFTTAAAVSSLSLASNYGALESIWNMQIGDNAPIDHLSDEAFRAAKRSLSSSSGMPVYYRVRSRALGSISIELVPTPDAAYLVDYEVQVRPKRLVLPTDVPLVDPQLLILGGAMMAKLDRGQDAAVETALFSQTLSSMSRSNSSSNLGDMKP